MGFGDFTSLCHMAPLPLCASIGPISSISSGPGIEPDCYARNIELANTLIFQGATSAMHIIALLMTVVMVLHVRGKFTAVGTSLSPMIVLLLSASWLCPPGVVLGALPVRGKG